MINALSIDVEDYFQVTAFERHVARERWGEYPLRVEANTSRVLDILASYDVRGTFFMLGWVAERLPGLVRKIRGTGHEIGCHGYGHELVYRIGPERFRNDIRKSKGLLEDITGQPVLGYRAPSYSITAKSLWALDILVEEGFSYDSSIFPIVHDVYGIPGGERFPHEITTRAGRIREFPISTLPLKLGRWQARIPIAGGGYLRLLPVLLVRSAIRYINDKENQPAVVYFHPWEIDPSQPRIKASFRSRFRHYLNLEGTENKIRNLLDNLKFSSLAAVLGFDGWSGKGA
ncbi:MAG: polysaccharide deacetylase [Geobacteraceae bacterium]|nr:polysaccharide deacetylase [Geobacteraceae bacterium]